MFIDFRLGLPAWSRGPARPGGCVPVRNGGAPSGARQGKSSASVD